MTLPVVKTLPKTSADAIRDFDDRFQLGIVAGPVPTWASDMGEVTTLDSPDTTYPISLVSVNYQPTQEQAGRFKTAQETELRLQVAEFDDGYEARLLDLTTKSFAYARWLAMPDAFHAKAAKHVCKQVAAILAAGASTVTTKWDNKALFSAAHLADPSGADVAGNQWSNYQSSATDVTDVDNLTTEITTMRNVKDESGEKLGVEPDTILAPTSAFQAMVNFFKSDFVLAGLLDGAGGGQMGTIKNPYMGTMNVIHAPELDDANNTGPIYILDSKLSAGLMPAWIAGQYVVPESLGLRFWDESSDYFKDTGKLKVSSHIWQGFTAAFPHAIRRVNRA